MRVTYADGSVARLPPSARGVSSPPVDVERVEVNETSPHGPRARLTHAGHGFEIEYPVLPISKLAGQRVLLEPSDGSPTAWVPATTQTQADAVAELLAALEKATAACKAGNVDEAIALLGEFGVRVLPLAK